MRTTIRMDEDLLRAAKAEAATSGRTLTAVIEDAVRESLARRGAAELPPVHLTTFHGDGLLPGVDLDSSAALLDVMEDRDGPP